MSVVGPSCGRPFSPHGCWLRTPVAKVREELRRAFARWGRPETIRVDNGGPWGSAGDLPPDLALWLIGLGIAVHWNDPHTPTQNGVVERSQGTGRRWAEPGQCDSVAELQRRLRMMDAIQRDSYPSIGGQSRTTAFPGLRHSGRAYSRAGASALGPPAGAGARPDTPWCGGSTRMETCRCTTGRTLRGRHAPESNGVCDGRPGAGAVGVCRPAGSATAGAAGGRVVGEAHPDADGGEPARTHPRTSRHVTSGIVQNLVSGIVQNLVSGFVQNLVSGDTRRRFPSFLTLPPAPRAPARRAGRSPSSRR